MERKSLHRIIALIMVTIVSTLMGLVQTGQAASRHIEVVSSLDFYAETAQAVLGTQGTATAIINSPSIDAEDFEPTTRTARQVADADVVIESGLGYDDWLHKVVAANDQQNVTINVGERLLHRKVGDNPHVWYAPKTMNRLTDALVQRFSKLQPRNKQLFAKNAQRYLATLKPWQDQVAAIKAQAQGKKVAVSEPVMNDTLQAAGLRVTNDHFARAVEEGTDPSPADIAHLTKALKQHRIAVWVVNVQNSQRVVDDMTATARKAGVPVIKVTETLPAHQTYSQWMTKQTTALQQALNKNR
ncbi:metal ABC transporter solute-binding protein, Zn/Mn family [Furfurilactobacillus siliginis]|uniref:Metal ABC transporter substrate-binding protein n=1 Tax=Furfurilactobacillus siliginis TaxID=348151 RepID=A0A0R2L3H8_9LACO|nr:zinc ABC transporter substrate-binding protein [Furfurilactobacillus siliginis]KRN95984.1 hypothetical protein IV55_GL001657 [Furfurilactobacillus siliginis]GEK28839.1 metal ABC transporter substrate-binding protein [Furfurilactobacillus siliginis]